MYWRLDPSMVRLILGMELRTLMRSRRTIIMSIVLPIVIMPIMIFASQYSVRSEERRAEEQVSCSAHTGAMLGLTGVRRRRDHLRRCVKFFTRRGFIPTEDI